MNSSERGKKDVGKTCTNLRQNSMISEAGPAVLDTLRLLESLGELSKISALGSQQRPIKLETVKVDINIVCLCHFYSCPGQSTIQS